MIMYVTHNGLEVWRGQAFDKAFALEQACSALMIFSAHVRARLVVHVA